MKESYRESGVDMELVKVWCEGERTDARGEELWMKLIE